MEITRKLLEAAITVIAEWDTSPQWHDRRKDVLLELIAVLNCENIDDYVICSRLEQPTTSALKGTCRRCSYPLVVTVESDKPYICMECVIQLSRTSPVKIADIASPTARN